MNEKLLETVADIAYYAGQNGYYSGNSRADASNIVWWAKEFEKLHELTDWDEVDYILSVEQFAKNKLAVSEAV